MQFSMRKPGLLRLIAAVACAPGDLRRANPPISAARTLAGSAPIFEANNNASPTASMFSATMIWLATLQVCPRRCRRRG